MIKIADEIIFVAIILRFAVSDFELFLQGSDLNPIIVHGQPEVLDSSSGVLHSDFLICFSAFFRSVISRKRHNNNFLSSTETVLILISHITGLP